MTVEQQLKAIAVNHRWAYEELVYDQKMIEWNWHTSCRVLNGNQEEQLFQLKKTEALDLFQSLNLMYKYLLRRDKTAERVLRSLMTLVVNQRTRRKTLWLVNHQ